MSHLWNVHVHSLLHKPVHDQLPVTDDPQLRSYDLRESYALRTGDPMWSHFQLRPAVGLRRDVGLWTQ